VDLYKPIRKHGYTYIAAGGFFLIVFSMLFYNFISSNGTSSIPVGETLLLIFMLLILIAVPLFIGIGLILRNKLAFSLYISSLKMMKWRWPKTIENHLKWIKDNNIERYLKE